jgi:hypothetical protein
MIIISILAILLAVSVYGSLLWEIRRLRNIVHWQTNQVNWCRATLSLWSDVYELPLPPEPLKPPDEVSKHGMDRN